MANEQLQSWFDLVNSQIAAEAFLGRAFGASDEEARVLALSLGLQIGNTNNSRFPFNSEEVPSALTDTYARRYELVAYQDLSFGLNNGVLNGYGNGPNLAPSKSGFAAVLLRDRLAEPGNSQYVLSVRSTEFADSIRDLGDFYAGLEIGLLGASLGQLEALNRFFAAAQSGSVVADGQGDPAQLADFAAYVASGGKVNVTGYSLGGQLATLFGELRRSEVQRVALVNAAGTGVPSGMFATPPLAQYQVAIDSAYAKFQAAFSDPLGYWNGLTAGQQASLEAVTLRTAIGKTALALVNGRISSPASYGAYQQWANLTATPLVKTLLSYIRSDSRITSRSRDHGIYDDPRYLFASIAATVGWQSAWQATDLFFGQALPQERPRVSDDRILDLYGFSASSTDLSQIIVARTGLRAGTRLPIFIEEQDTWRFPQNLIYSTVTFDYGDGHSIVLLQDSLALMAAFERLAPAVTQEVLGDILERVSNKRYDSLERGLDALRALVQHVDLSVSGARTSGGALPGDFAAMQYRGPYYERLMGLLSDIRFTEQVGKLSIEPLSGRTIDQLKTDATKETRKFATLYALRELNPFVAMDADYSVHNTSGALEIATTAGGPGQLSQRWIEQRASMLVAKLERNTGDTTLAYKQGNESWWYEDRRLGERVFVIGSEFNSLLLPESSEGKIENFLSRGNTISHRVIFDADQDPAAAGGVLVGHKYDDHLFGGGGKDILRGNEGNDHLEGGNDRDILLGGLGDDTLAGGKGDDDRLDGGLGFDTYVWRAGDGKDQIVDAIEPTGPFAGRRAGKISFGEASDLSGTKSVESIGNDKRFRDVAGNLYVLEGVHGKDGTLTITPASGEGELKILGFKDGDFGISLSLAGFNPPELTEFLGTTNDDNFYSFDPIHGDTLTSSAPNRLVLGLAGDDRIKVSGANSVVMGGTGADLILNGPDDQKLFGEEGNDILLASAGNDEVDGGVGDDVLQGGLGDDYLVGGPEDVTATGSSDDDLIDGGPGSDVIFGGDGNDLLVGGGNLVPTVSVLDDDHTLYSYGYKRQADNSMRIERMAGYDIGAADPFSAPWLALQDGYFNVDGDLADFIDGGAGDDFVLAGDGDDVVLGGSGADLLVGQVGDDYIEGGSGDDTLMGDGSRGSLVFGSDINLVYALDQYHGADTLFGDAGDDVLYGDGGADELYGGEGNDVLIGDAAADKLGVAFHGDDYLDGGAGDDFLYGYGGKDTLFGSDGNDRLEGDGAPSAIPYANHGDDYLDGEDGNDTVVGGGGADTLFGGSGNDTLAGDGDDVPAEFQGADYLDGEAGNDVLQGYGGDDTLIAGKGDDTLAGGKGNDRYVVELGDGADTIIDGTGTNTVVFGAGISAANLSLAQGLDPQGLGYLVVTYSASDSLAIQAGFNGIQLFEFADGKKLSPFTLYQTLASAGALPVVSGGSGNDVLSTGPLSQLVQGGAGDDTYSVSRGSGWSRILDQAGTSDRVVFDPSVAPAQVRFLRRGNGNLEVELLDADDPTILSTRVVVAGQFSDAGNRIETFEFGDDAVVRADDLEALAIAELSGTAADDELQGALLQGEVFSGNEGSDSLRGGFGDDVYRYAMGDGNDVISDFDGFDQIDFAPGVSREDVFVERKTNEDLVLTLGDGGSITVTGQFLDPSNPAMNEIRFADGTAIDAAELAATPVTVEFGTEEADTLVGGQADDTLYGLGGDDSIAGNLGSDVLVGGQGNDELRGGEGDDVLSGEEGNDSLLGGAGRDLLYGDAGDDLLDGGSGDDLMQGGGGSDVYSVYAGMGADVAIDGEGGETNVLQLGAALAFENLATKRLGDSLVVSLRGLEDSVTISDYYTRPQDWVVRDSGGVESTLDAVINQPDPHAGNYLARVWADAKMGAAAAVLGQAHTIGWTPIGGNSFSGFQEQAFLDYLRQTTVETFFRFEPPHDQIAQNTFEDFSYTLDSFGQRSTPNFFWFLHSFESGYVESDDPFIQGSGLRLQQLQSPGQAVLTLAPDRTRLLNYQLTQLTSTGGVVSYDTGTETILASVVYDYETESYSQAAEVTSVNPNPTSWFHAKNSVVGNRVLVDMTRVESRYLSVNEIFGGPSDNTIVAGSSDLSFPLVTLIDGGAGNDRLFGDGGLLYGNSGDDELAGSNAVLIGGDGNDTITGFGGTRFIYTATEAGVDAISELGVATQSYLDWYYQGLGISGWMERAEHGGQYRVSGDEGDLDYYDTLIEAQEAGGGSSIAYIEPLSSSAPVVRRSDAATLQALESAGVLTQDVVTFGPGIGVSDLDLTVRVLGRNADEHPEEPWHGGGTLKVRWGAGAGFDLTVPDVGYGLVGDDLLATVPTPDGVSTHMAWEGYALGDGIELFEFDDGTRYTLEELLQRAVVERVDGYQFVRGSGSQTVDRVWLSVDFAPDIAPTDIYALRAGNDLVFGVIADSALGRVEGWYADPASVPQMEFHFADTIWDTDTVTRLGTTQRGSSFGDFLAADPQFASALIGLDGSDFLTGGAGNDLLDGGPGHDFLFGQDGNDVYVFRPGSGVDAVNEPFDSPTGGYDTVRFVDGIEPADLIVDRDFDMLTLSLDNGEDFVWIPGWFSEPDGKVEAFEFADGTIWDAAAVEVLLPAAEATPEDDLLLGLTSDDLLDGLEGNDDIRGFAGNDILRGGPGYDFLDGGAGDDTYEFELGHGVDFIWDRAGSNVLLLGSGIGPQTVSVTRDQSTLFLVVGSGGDRVGLLDWFDAGSPVSQVAFADGPIWLAADLESRVTLVAATEFDDVLWGTDGADDISGLAGQDEIYGNGGDDVIDGGDGADYLDGGSGNDLLRGGAGDDGLEGWQEGHKLLEGGEGDDYIAYETRSIAIGGPGDDWIDVYGFNGIVAFNPGDGADTVAVYESFTLSIGGGVSAADLSLSEDGTDVVISVGASDSVRLTNDVGGGPGSWPTIVLQLFGSAHLYSLGGAIDEFYDARDADPSLSELGLGDVLPRYLLQSSETGALGGVIAHQYATRGTIAHVSDAQLLSVLRDPRFGPVLQDTAFEGDNSAPVLANPLVDLAANEDAVFEHTIPADAFTDSDAGDELTYSATLDGGSGLPTWLSFDAGARTFSGTPLQADVGTIGVTVTATDSGGLSAHDTFALTVANVNDAPVVAMPLADLSFEAGAPFSFSVPAGTFSDEDPGDTLSINGTIFGGGALPAWLTFAPGTGTFVGNPEASDIGISHLQVTATDTAGATASSDFGLVVRAAAGSEVVGSAGDDVIFGGTGDETLTAKGGSDYLFGDVGDDLLKGGSGNDVLQGGEGADVLRGGKGQNVLDGGAGDDLIFGGKGSSLIAGGTGDDTIRTGAGNDVILFNRGDGRDTVIADRSGDNTLSFGGGIRYSDISLSRDGKNLVVSAGGDDQVILKNWYGGKRSVLSLQIILDATDEFDASSSDLLYNRKVQTFDFLGMVSAFDSASAESPGLTSWAITNALLQFHLSGADDMALGGDLGYWYGKKNSFAGISLSAAQQVIGAAGFGSDAQTLRPFDGLQEGFMKLS